MTCIPLLITKTGPRGNPPQPQPMHPMLQEMQLQLTALAIGGWPLGWHWGCFFLPRNAVAKCKFWVEFGLLSEETEAKPTGYGSSIVLSSLPTRGQDCTTSLLFFFSMLRVTFHSTSCLALAPQRWTLVHPIWIRLHLWRTQSIDLSVMGWWKTSRVIQFSYTFFDLTLSFPYRNHQFLCLHVAGKSRRLCWNFFVAPVFSTQRSLHQVVEPGWNARYLRVIEVPSARVQWWMPEKSYGTEMNSFDFFCQLSLWY